MSSPEGLVVGRLAPSPTGGLHLGHARTFLLAWLFARKAGGRMILRIEDLDASRVRAEAIETAQADLNWLGLNWDEGPDRGGPSGPYLQSERSSVYEVAMARLRDGERIYPCTCSRADIARLALAPHAEDEGPTYPGTCSGRTASDARTLQAEGRPFAWRFRVPPGQLAWDDLLLGRMTIDPSRVGGDFLVGRQGLGPSYQLAVVCDDAAMGVNQVIRGDDLIPSTPRQILLHQALGTPPPSFGHVGLVHGPDGRRLAKRDGSIKMEALREAGLGAIDFIGWLAWTLGLVDHPTPVRPENLVGDFEPQKIPTARYEIPAAHLARLVSGESAC